MKRLISFLKDEEGATAVEYGLIVALIAAICIFTVTALGLKVNSAFNKVEVAMPA